MILAETAQAAMSDILIRRAICAETISDYQSFLDLAPVWDDAVRVAEIDHPFLEHAWLRTWWDCFGGNSKLHVVVVKRGDEILAIAPLISTPVQMFGIAVRRLGLFYNSHVPRTGFIVVREPEVAYPAIWGHLLAERGSWDLLQLCQLPEGSSTHKQMERLAGEAGFPFGIWCSGASPYIWLDKSWAQYYDELATKHRSNLRNRFKRLKELGLVSLETVTEKERLSDALVAALQLEEAAWKREAGTAISSDAQVQKFYETFAQHAADKQWLRLNFLRSGEARIAFDYSLEYKGRSFLLKLGYDPAFAACSPSNLLLSMSLERAFSQGLAKYEFLGETAEWKRCWTLDATANYWLFIFADTFTGRWLRFVKFRLIPAAKAVRTSFLRMLTSLRTGKL